MLGGIETYRCPWPLGLFLFEWWAHQQKFFWHEGMYSSLSYTFAPFGILKRRELHKGFLIHHILKKFIAHLMLFLVWNITSLWEEEAKKEIKRLTWTKGMQARYSHEGRPCIFHLGGDTLKLQAFPCEQLWCHLVASFFRSHPMFPI
jgi:hypothetical protein